jgi:hypothetical protein
VPEHLIHEAFCRLVDIGWIEANDSDFNTSHEGARFPHPPAGFPQQGVLEGIEGNEWKEGNEAAAAQTPPPAKPSGRAEHAAADPPHEPKAPRHEPRAVSQMPSPPKPVPKEPEELPETLAAIRSCRNCESADLVIARKIAAKARDKVPQAGDQEIAEAVRKAWKPGQRSAALFLVTVPNVIETLMARRPRRMTEADTQAEIQAAEQRQSYQGWCDAQVENAIASRFRPDTLAQATTRIVAEVVRVEYPRMDCRPVNGTRDFTTITAGPARGT